MVKKCICEICTCGRHRCPHRPNAPFGSDKPCMLTEYAHTYHPHPINLRESCKPAARVIDSDVPIEDKTTQRVDYVKHAIERPYQRVPDAYKKPAGDHDMLTSYTKDYPQKHVDPAKAIKHDMGRQAHGKFEGEPTYTSDYRKWDMSRPQRYGPDASWEPPKQKFEGQSTFQHDYTRYNEPPRQPLRPANAAIASGPFDDRTGYRDDYVRHPLGPKFQKEREKYKPAGVPMDGLTTFMRDYRGERGDRTKAFKPEGRPVASDVPLDDITTQKNDYRKWPTERPFHHQPDQYKKPEGDIDTNTTHRLTYKQHPLQRHAAIKPPPGRVMNAGQFDGVTNYNMDYKPWEIDRVHPTMQPKYQPNDAPFEGISTQKAHYVPHSLNPTASFKPHQAAINSGPFDDGTIYRMEYTPKHIGPCPAAILDTTSAQYRFVELDPRGHKLYRPMSYTTVTDLGRSAPGNAAHMLQPLAVA